MNLITSLLLLLAIFTINVEAYKFLAILNWTGRSHFISASALIKALAEKGHDVTVISPYPQVKPLKNYHDIQLHNNQKAADGVMIDAFDFYNGNFITTELSISELGYYITKATLEEPEVQALLHSNQTFDAVICSVFASDALYGFSDHFNAPLIGFSSIGSFSSSDDMIGSPSPPSYVPHIFSPFSQHMTRWERLLNLAILTFNRLHMNFIDLPRQETLYKQHFPHAKRSMYDVRKNAALMLINKHFSLSFSRPLMPNQIEVGGLHINRKPPNPLPADIQKFIDDAKHGVIYFSMGSNLRTTSMSPEKRNAMLETFRELKQHILWKYEGPNLADKPENVYISDWFPQNDILAHPNVKLFITHGGLLSTTETIYYGKPVIGIPIFADQFLNMKSALHSGYGITLEYATLTKSTFKSAIEEILNNSSYTERVQEMSNHYRDQPMEPLELGIFWVEHIVRHKGAKYMHCAGLDLSFIEYHNIDVMLILYGGFAVVVCLLLVFIFKVLRKFFGMFGKPKSTKKLKRK